MAVDNRRKPARIIASNFFDEEGTDMLTVNFAPELSEIILESKYLEQLGFTIPELARNMSLQEYKYGMQRLQEHSLKYFAI